MNASTLAIFNLGGGEIILIFAILFIMAAVPAGIVLLVLLIVRASQRKTSLAPPARDLEQELRTAAKLRDDGVITEEDFNLKKKAILGI